MAVQHPHRTAPDAIPRQRAGYTTPRGTEPANALSPLRTRFISAIAGIVFLGILCIACVVALAKGAHPQGLPIAILVISVLLLLSAVVDAGYLLRRLRRELSL